MENTTNTPDFGKKVGYIKIKDSNPPKYVGNLNLKTITKKDGGSFEVLDLSLDKEWTRGEFAKQTEWKNFHLSITIANGVQIATEQKENKNLPESPMVMDELNNLPF